MQDYLKILLVIFGFVCSEVHSQEVAVPAWEASEFVGGGLSHTASYLPPEYAGQNSIAVREQLAERRSVSGKNCRLEFTPKSGVLSYWDDTGATARHVGWDTGYARVYSVILNSPATGVSFDTFSVLVWNATTNKSELFELKVLDTGVVQQSTSILQSPVNEIWGFCSSTAGKMYIYELQSHTIVRYVDSNSDGVWDTKDGGFSVAVPLENFAAPYNPSTVAGRAHPIRGLKDAGSKGLLLIEGGANRVGHRYIRETSPGVFTYVEDQAALSIATLNIVGMVTIGQTRVQVHGTKGLSFKVFAELSNGTVSAISPANSIPSSRTITVETAVLVAGSKVFAQQIDGDKIESTKRKVRTTAKGVHFKTQWVDYVEKSRIQLFGDKFNASMVNARLQWGGTNVATVPVLNLTPYSFEVDLPLIGAAGGSAPFTKRTFVTIWLEDASGNEKTIPSRIAVQHN